MTAAVKTFNPENFTPTEWDSAEQKSKFCHQFVKFVNGGFQEKNFPKWFYQRLSNTFRHIAHYDHAGFFLTWFSSLEDQLAFLRRTILYPCYGDPTCTYSDAERLLVEWTLKSGHIERLEREIEQATETAERAVYARLKAKYG